MPSLTDTGNLTTYGRAKKKNCNRPTEWCETSKREEWQVYKSPEGDSAWEETFYCLKDSQLRTFTNYFWLKLKRFSLISHSKGCLLNRLLQRTLLLNVVPRNPAFLITTDVVSKLTAETQLADGKQRVSLNEREQWAGYRHGEQN